MITLHRTGNIVFGLAIAAFIVGCGGGSSGSSDNGADNGNNTVSNQNPSQDNTTNSGYETNSTQDPIVAGYSAANGILIETKSDGSKRAWVNTTGNECLIYRISSRGGTIVDGGTTHCENLNFAGIDTWRMPTEEEAVYFMAHVPVNSAVTRNTDPDYIIYPDNNPNCQFMATATAGRYVYTTNNPNNGAFSDPNRGTAGIRCVADQ